MKKIPCLINVMLGKNRERTDSTRVVVYQGLFSGDRPLQDLMSPFYYQNVPINQPLFVYYLSTSMSC